LDAVSPASFSAFFFAAARPIFFFVVLDELLDELPDELLVADATASTPVAALASTPLVPKIPIIHTPATIVLKMFFLKNDFFIVFPPFCLSFI
jgi:hypothetical protein